MALPTPEKPPVMAKKPANIWLIVSIVLAVILVGVLAVNLVKMPGKSNSKLTVVSSDKASASLLDFLNQVYASRIGAATLKSVTQESGLYKIAITINPPATNGQAAAPVDQTVYLTMDGKLFVPQTIIIADTLKQFQAFQQQQQAAGTAAQAPAVTAPATAGTAATK